MFIFSYWWISSEPPGSRADGSMSVDLTVMWKHGQYLTLVMISPHKAVWHRENKPERQKGK